MKPSNSAIIHRFQNKVLRNIVDTIWYIRNVYFHRDLNMEMVTAEIRWFARKQEEKHLSHNVEAIHLLDNSNLLQRMKITKPFQLVPLTINHKHRAD
jgi:hypothetical protein